MKKIKGYCTHQEFGGYKIPIPVQNIILRDYSIKNNFDFKLSVNEFYFNNCYMRLNGLIDEVLNSDLSGIIMASFTILPQNSKERLSIYDKLINANKTIYFVIENLALKSKRDCEELETIFTLKKELQSCLQPDKEYSEDILKN